MEENLIIYNDRKLFYMYCDVEKYADGKKFMFADELTEYTFVPYVGKLRKIPGYEENESLFEDARIYLLSADNTSARMVPCNVVEEQKCIYLSDGSFNRYWKRISGSLWKGFKCLSEVSLLQEDMNRRVDLSYMKMLYREVEIKEDYTLFYNEKLPEIEIQCPVRKCVIIDEKQRKHYTKDSDKRDLIQAGAQDHKKYMECYLELFQEVSSERLYDLFIVKQAACCWTNNGLYLICEEDHWQIKYKESEFCLLHNNYSTCLAGNRIFDQNWHREKARTVNQALRTICKYNFLQHRRWTDQRLVKEGTIRTNRVVAVK